MSHFKKYAVFIVGVSVMSSVAWSMVTTPPLHFSGAYLGGDLGAAWGRSSYQTNPGCGSATQNAVFCNISPDLSAANGTAVSASGTGKMRSNRLIGGAEAGYNWQKDRLVLGVEADMGAFDLSQSVRKTGVFPFQFLGSQYTLTESFSTNWLATVRGRVGFTLLPQCLMYATGGAAFTNAHVSSSLEVTH